MIRKFVFFVEKKLLNIGYYYGTFTILLTLFQLNLHEVSEWRTKLIYFIGSNLNLQKLTYLSYAPYISVSIVVSETDRAILIYKSWYDLKVSLKSVSLKSNTELITKVFEVSNELLVSQWITNRESVSFIFSHD